MDAPLPTTLIDDAVPEETNDSTKSDQATQGDGDILAQLAVNLPVVPLTSSDNPPVVDDPLVQDALDLSLQGDEALQGEN